MGKQEIKKGDKIYYISDNGDICEGYIYDIINHNAILGNISINDVFYEITDKVFGEPVGVTMKRSEIYTIKDLFDIKNEYEYLVRRKEELEKSDINENV